VDFTDEKGASHARRMLFLEDKTGIRRQELGDQYLEITFKKQTNTKDNINKDSTNMNLNLNLNLNANLKLQKGSLLG